MCIDAITKQKDDEFYSMQDIKEMSVWMYVELMAVQILQRSGHPDWN